MTARLKGKMALISGTGSGMGCAAARLFAAEGAVVVGTDINDDSNSETAELVRKDGYAMSSIAPLDLSEPAGAHAWIAAAVEQHGGIDILYNNGLRVGGGRPRLRRTRHRGPALARNPAARPGIP